MSEVSRRRFVELTAVSTLGAGTALAAAATTPATAGAPGAGVAPRRGAPTPRPQHAAGVDLIGDGLPIGPNEYAQLLARLTADDGVTLDEYSRGGTVERLEKRFAELLGKETAVFMPSGTLANQLAVRLLAGDRRRVIVQELSHLYNDSGDCAQNLSELNLIPMAPGRATFTWDEVDAVLQRAASGRVPTPTGAIAIESPVRRLHGATFEYGELQRVTAQARERGIGTHLDGARMFVECAYSGREPAEVAANFDTVYVSLWKCFNSGSGAILAGPHALLDEAYHVRRMFGGNLWRAWPFAAVAMHFAEGYLGRLRAAVQVSEQLIVELAGSGRVRIERVPQGTSLFRIEPATADLRQYRQRLGARGVHLPAPDHTGFWLKVNESLAGADAAAIAGDMIAAL